MRINFVAPARRELLQEVLYYHQQEPGLGAAFVLEIEAATARALAFPEAGSPATMNTRRVFVKKFPFSVVYRPDHEGIVVFAVAHHSRKPNYWASRV
ncbi:type II toxin-antitoxin system RelE/ParE family toxin [Alkalimonas mucilaginosa]|uniref:Type II toxin-antitoxin system RelE/ParE family toxin n=1 Tax=Alkalimonas mucilaginosa TaxID=3057676 RepID=A0ABU7JAT9_9GAMM|nr:type II toxin-antitoxin system RelE/ParE family toxin [Alkalimonas sp. MEB004]MEE2022817.1 type II toxin-antitoxin system RelE/ParE family toxin [Alkalimonas sp. MEB004]